MATIVKTPSNSWKAVVRKKGWPTTAKTFRTKLNAVDWARRIEDEMVRGVFIDRSPSEKLTVKAALARYLAEVSPTKAATTQKSEKNRAKPLEELLGDYSLAALSPQVVAGYRDKRLATTNRYGRPMSASQVRLELALLGHLFTIAIKEWGIGLMGNPVQMIRRPKPAPGRDRRLSADEQATLLKHASAYSNPMPRWIIELAIETGMRKSELLGVRRSRVDLKRRIVHLPETKNGSVRQVPLTKRATQVFEEALASSVRPMDCDLVFFGEPGRDGQRRAYQIDPAWSRIRKATKIQDLKFHDLRHEAVSRLVEMGLSDQEVAAISGHRSMQMLKRYTHLRAEDLVQRLDQSANSRID